MKELTIEQKAKAYNKALDIAKKNYDAAQDLCEGSQIGVECFKDTLANIFPELKEVGDERIRKFLHHTFTVQYLAKDGLGKWHGEPVSNILAWLEKQSRNPYSGVSFEYNGNIWGMCARDNGVDILLNKELIQHVSAEKQGEQNLIMAKSPQLGEQKPAWSEEDERVLKATINTVLISRNSCEEDDEIKDRYDDELRWLKSLKDRVGCETNCTTMWKPTEGQIKALKDACDEHWEPDGLDLLYTLYQDLKKL